MNAVKALQETAGREVTVNVDSVMAFVMEANAFAEGCGVGKQDHTARVFPEPRYLCFPILHASVYDGRPEFTEDTT